MTAETIVARLLGEADLPFTAGEFVDDYLQQRGVHPQDVEDHQVMRVLRVLKRYFLVLWDTGMRNGNHNYVGYRFVGPNGQVLFQGTDLGVPQNEAIDSDDVVRTLLKFITLKPGDTDPEAFENYTSEQLEFTEGDDAHQLRIDLEYAENAAEPPFEDTEPQE